MVFVASTVCMLVSELLPCSALTSLASDRAFQKFKNVKGVSLV